MKIKRFGVSLEKDLLKELDSLSKRNKFPSRSQAIRFLIRKNLIEEAWQADEAVSGAVILIYDHHKRELINKSLAIQHSFASIILATQHIHLDHYNCLEVIALKGRASSLRELSDMLISLKGVKHGKLVVSATEAVK
jgi:CopG family nickel-responsive transcriptional regulator